MSLLARVPVGDPTGSVAVYDLATEGSTPAASARSGAGAAGAAAAAARAAAAADARPTVLLAHATGFHANAWAPLAAALTRHRPVAFDFRGHGASPRPAGDEMHWQGYVDDALAVIDALAGLGVAAPRVAMGHSLGATILLLVEAARPGTFDAIVVYEPIVHPPGEPVVTPGTLPIAEAARRRRATFPSLDAARENYAAKPPLSRIAPAALDAYVRHGFVPAQSVAGLGDTGVGGTGVGVSAGEVRLACDPEHEALTFEGSNSIRAWDHLAAVRCPVLVLAGAGARIGPVAMAEPVASELPNGHFHRFDDLDHLGPMEDPPAVAAVAEAFLDHHRC